MVTPFNRLNSTENKNTSTLSFCISTASMANSDGGDQRIEFRPNPSLSWSPSSPSTPLNLCGFQTGDTVQVRGDNGELQFSVQFNLRREQRRSDDPLDFADENIPDSVQSSPYLTPTSSTGEFENHDGSASADEPPRGGGGVMTRLRSGALSPVKYYFGRITRVPGGRTQRKSKKGTGKRRNLFDEMLRRRRLPLRPCSSYAFFVVKNYGVFRRSSFVETSKRLSKQWAHLPHDMKKEYEDMALKDNARYKRQCMLLSNDVEEGITTCSC